MAHNGKVIPMKLDSQFYKKLENQSLSFLTKIIKRQQNIMAKCWICHLKILM